jgi:hypothetical protein
VVQSCHIASGNSPLSCRALFQYQVSHTGKAGRFGRYLPGSANYFLSHPIWAHCLAVYVSARTVRFEHALVAAVERRYAKLDLG